MEVLKIKQLVNGVSVVLVAGSIVWIVTTLIEVDKRTAITEVKVSENHKMLKPLWEEFIRRNTDGYVERLDEQTDFKVRFKWKQEKKKEKKKNKKYSEEVLLNTVYYVEEKNGLVGVTGSVDLRN